VVTNYGNNNEAFFMTSSQMKQEFVKKYGSQNLKSYERAVSEYMD